MELIRHNDVCIVSISKISEVIVSKLFIIDAVKLAVTTTVLNE